MIKPKKERGEITQRQADMYMAINAYWGTHRRSPSVRDLGELMGIKSPNGVKCHLSALTKKGWIEGAGEQKTRGLLTEEVINALEKMKQPEVKGTLEPHLPAAYR